MAEIPCVWQRYLAYARTLLTGSTPTPPITENTSFACSCVFTPSNRLLPTGYELPKSTLSECTNFNPTRRDGEPKPPKTLSVDTLLAISLALNVFPNYLLGYEPCEMRKREGKYNNLNIKRAFLAES